MRRVVVYKEEKEFNVLKGQISDFGYDIKMLSVVVDDKKESNIPARGLYKTNVDCTNGTRGEWDYNAWNLTLENVSSNAKCNITFTSNLSEEEYNKYIEAGKALRRNTYRGKDITEYHNDGSLYEMISNGTFDDIYVGDYIVANNVTWLVADIDNYLYSGDTPLTRHHLTMIPATTLVAEAKMNDTATTNGGYLGSNMVSSILPNVLSTYVQPAFGNHIITYRNWLTNAMDETKTSAGGTAGGGASNGCEWVNRQIDLMNEMSVTGGSSMTSSAFDLGIDHSQYALFQLKPEFISSYAGARFSYWLRDIYSSTGFASISYATRGFAGDWHSDFSRSVRPYFLIG